MGDAKSVVSKMKADPFLVLLRPDEVKARLECPAQLEPAQVAFGGEPAALVDGHREPAEVALARHDEVVLTL
jgi:hypothetical protein